MTHHINNILPKRQPIFWAKENNNNNNSNNRNSNSIHLNVALKSTQLSNTPFISMCLTDMLVCLCGLRCVRLLGMCVCVFEIFNIPSMRLRSQESTTISLCMFLLLFFALAKWYAFVCSFVFICLFVCVV